MFAKKLADALNDGLIPSPNTSRRYLGPNNMQFTIINLPQENLFDNYDIRIVFQKNEEVSYTFRFFLKTHDTEIVTDSKKKHGSQPKQVNRKPNPECLVHSIEITELKTDGLEKKFFYHHETNQQTYRLAMSWCRNLLNNLFGQKLEHQTVDGICAWQGKRAKEIEGALQVRDYRYFERMERKKQAKEDALKIKPETSDEKLHAPKLAKKRAKKNPDETPSLGLN